MYKISICCEYNGEQLLSFNNDAIDTKKYPNIRDDICIFLQPIMVKFVNSVNILHKDCVEETETEFRTLSVKNLEFVCNRAINKREFEWFIYYLKLCGFDTSSNTNTIMMWSSDGELIFNYNFKHVVPVFKNKRVRSIDWNYKTQIVV
jgi:hypothetical protein